MNDDFVFPTSWRPVRLYLSGLIFLYPVTNDGTYPDAESFRLQPTTISQRGVVWGGRGEMPLFVSGVESVSVPVISLSLVRLQLDKKPVDPRTEPSAFRSPARAERLT